MPVQREQELIPHLLPLVLLLVPPLVLPLVLQERPAPQLQEPAVEAKVWLEFEELRPVVIATPMVQVRFASPTVQVPKEMAYRPDEISVQLHCLPVQLALAVEEELQHWLKALHSDLYESRHQALHRQPVHWSPR